MHSQPHRSFARFLSWLLIPALVLPLAGCGSKPQRLLQTATKAEKEAQAAEARVDVEAANRAAEAAGDAVGQLQKFVEEDKSRSADLREVLAKAQTAELSAREFAALAGEERELRDRLASLKVRAYQKARTAILTTVLPQMAVVAKKAGELGTNGLSVIERPLAEQAWKLASLVSGRSPSPDGRADWSGVASDFGSWSTNPPMEFRAFLGLALVLAGSGDFALAEFESVNAGSLRGTNALRIYHGGRALLYAMRGWNRLATREVEAFGNCAESSEGAVNGKQILALMHGFLAYSALTKREFEKMDAEVTQSLRAWPDNPLVVFLTSEKLAANGEWEKAANSLEALAAGIKDEGMVKLLAQRARDLRDGKGGTQALALDARFLVQVAAHCAYTAAKDSAAGRRLGEAFDEAVAFGRNLRSSLPLFGGAGADVSTNENRSGEN
jgi:hypothetical protein